MSTEHGYYIVDFTKAAEVISECQRGGWHVFQLPENIATKVDFFDGVRQTLPLDPPFEREDNHVWDALIDSLWYGLYMFPERNMVIVWPNASTMQSHSPREYALAELVLKEMVERLSDLKLMDGKPKGLIVLQVH